MVSDLIKVKDLQYYIYRKTGVHPSRYKIKQWIRFGWIRLIRPQGYDHRFKYTTTNFVDKFISEHQAPDPEPEPTFMEVYTSLRKEMGLKDIPDKQHRKRTHKR